MSLLERRKQLEQESARKALDAKKLRQVQLAETVTNGFKTEGITEIIEEHLVTYGRVCVTGFGCLCQGGFCSWQEGFTDFLTDLISEWKEKGVTIHFGIDGVNMYLEGAKTSGYYTPKINHITLEIK